MRFKNLFLILSVLLVVLVCIGSVSASDNNIYDDNLTVDSSDMKLELGDGSDLNDEKLTESGDDSLLSEGQTVAVDNVGENHNEMNEHTIRNAIQNANAGDTIIVNGAEYVHCHIVIDKQLTIKSNVGTRLSSCSSTAFSAHQGVFYLTSGASGTIIEGFNFNNDDEVLYDNEGYEILVDGASNVIIRNCTFSNGGYGDSIRLENTQNALVENVVISDAVNGIKIKNSEGVTVRDSAISNSQYGLYDVDSTKTVLTSNDIKNNKVAGIEIAGTSNNPTISFNNITNSNYGIELTSCDNIDILSNYVALNSMYGVYVNAQIIKVNITGNFFFKNSFSEGGEILNGPNAKGFFKQGGEQLEIINNNYMVGNNVRPVNNNPSGGAFLGYTFEINENVACPILHFKYEQALWSDGNYRLKLSEITQSNKGIYSISIVDDEGNVAKGLSSVPVTFYLNKNNNYVTPQDGDVYKVVRMVDGTATVRFYAEDFNSSGNILTAVLPGLSDYITGDQNKNVKTFEINDSEIPGEITKTKINMADLSTGPMSGADYTIALTDVNNNPISNATVIVNINSVDIPVVTNAQGQATIKINQNSGSYIIKASYDGDLDYASSNAQATITVNELPPVVVEKISTKIVASNYAILVKKADYYTVTLKDAYGNLLSGQKITFKVNKKTYNVKTNANGVAKIKLKLKKGTYKVVMNYRGNSQYNAAKKTTKIYVKKTLKTKLSAPKVTTSPKTSTIYTVTLKNQNGKVLAKQKVTIKVNGKTYTKKTNNKGQATIKVKFSKLKSYNVKIAFKGTKLYKKSSATGKITVSKIATDIDAPNIDTIPNTDKDYTVTLKTSAGKAIAKQSIKISFDGKTYTKTTNSYGQATVQTNFEDENTYNAVVSYAGSGIYKSSNAVGAIKVSRVSTQLTSYDRTFSRGSSEGYSITLKDENGNQLANQLITYNLNNNVYSQNTDVKGQVKVDISSLNVGSYNIAVNYAQSNQYRSSYSNSLITVVNKTDVTFIDANMPNDEIQARFDGSLSNVEFLGNVYNDVSLTINKAMNITFMPNTTLNGKAKSTVLTISASNISISDLKINSNEGSGIVIQNAENVVLKNNVISNNLDQSKVEKYNSGEIAIPGNGIELSNAMGVIINNNDVKSFANAIFAQNSDDVEIANNTLSLSNYGITYGDGVKNTKISDNLITKNIGLYVMDVPEGPLGYGIYLYQSAVNVTIVHNNISNNYMGISVDSNYSTGIVITSNLICDNALEGIRFNAGYDLAENAVEPDVNDNAIYRNAKGPSMMILGELSANPAGIYQYGPEDDTQKLQLGTNWYGKNARVTWDYDKNITGYGTMCPRIATTYISVKEIEVVSPGTFSVSFYKNDVIDTELPVFGMYATLNDDIEINFDVVNGVGTFSFESENFSSESNVIKVSIGSLKDEYRTFEVLLNKTLDISEISA